jgi:hypothetical protein
LTWHPQLVAIKISAVSQKTRQERGTLEDYDEERLASPQPNVGKIFGNRGLNSRE